MFKGTTDEPCASSLQTRASHGTKMLSPEALAAEFGRKEWKHFMPDTGMAFRSGTVVGAAPPFPRLMFWILNLWHQDTERKKKKKQSRPSLPPAGQDAQDSSCAFIEIGCIISHVCLVFLWQLVRFYLMFLLIHLLLVLE